jgi:protein-disulfide isomerase
VTKRSEKRRAARSSGGSEIKRFYWVLGAVAVLGLVAVGYSVSSEHMSKVATKPVDVPGLDNMSTLVEKAKGVTMGRADAPVTIAEFGDYMCPACGEFTLAVKPRIISQYVDSGKVKFVFYDFPLVSIHPNSFIAARAARCAGDQDKYWKYQQELYRHQVQWTPLRDPVGEFLDYADSAGLDRGTFESCVKSDKHADVVSANERLAEELGLNSTPTIMVSGRGNAKPVRLGGWDFEIVKTQVDSVLAAEGDGS